EKHSVCFEALLLTQTTYNEAGADTACLIFVFELCRLKAIFELLHDEQMTRIWCTVAISCLAFGVWFPASVLVAQEVKASSSAGSGAGVTEEKAIALAEQGHCKEALPSLKRTLGGQGPA